MVGGGAGTQDVADCVLIAEAAVAVKPQTLNPGP
jgi:hypothetical protein